MRQVNYAQAVSTIGRATADATDTRPDNEVQGEIVANGSMVPGLRMSRERTSGRYRMLAEQDKKRPAEKRNDANPMEAGDCNELSSLELARSWQTNSNSHERARHAMEEPAGLDLAVRRQLPGMPSSRHNRVDMLMVPHRVPISSPTTGSIANLRD